MLSMLVISEDLPLPDNRVRLTADGRINLDYTYNNLEGHERLVKKLHASLDGFVDHAHPISQHHFQFDSLLPLYGTAHQAGTVRFGTDPKSSVLDPWCKAHELDNLYVVDTSFFPSIAAVNPTLTTVANALPGRRPPDRAAGRIDFSCGGGRRRSPGLLAQGGRRVGLSQRARPQHSVPQFAWRSGHATIRAAVGPCIATRHAYFGLRAASLSRTFRNRRPIPFRARPIQRNGPAAWRDAPGGRRNEARIGSRRELPMSLSAARLDSQGAPPSAIGQTLALDAGGVVFELGALGPLDWSYDGLRPQLQFTFDAGQAIAAFQDAPARGVSCAPGLLHAAVAGDAGAHPPRSPARDPVPDLSGRHPGRACRPQRLYRRDRRQPADHHHRSGVRALAMEARRALVEEADPDRRYMAALGKAMLARALQAIDQGAPPRGRAAISPFKLRRVVDHIEARLDSKISVQELAELAGLSSAHFTRAFRQATGEAPHHFILDRRVARVRELLRDPALNLATVAARAGFASHAHMSSVFRRRPQPDAGGLSRGGGGAGRGLIGPFAQVRESAARSAEASGAPARPICS